jgi:hypothetical protein
VVTDVLVLVRLLLLVIVLGLAASLIAVVLPALRAYLGGDAPRRRGAHALPPAPDQMERLEERLDQLSNEQQQLADQQEFITRLLQERTDRPRDAG